jgi:hypothetical protein
LLLQLLPFSQMPAPQLVVTAAVLAAAVPSAAALAKANRSTITTFEKTVVSPRRPFFYVRMKEFRWGVVVSGRPHLQNRRVAAFPTTTKSNE